MLQPARTSREAEGRRRAYKVYLQAGRLGLAGEQLGPLKPVLIVHHAAAVELLNELSPHTHVLVAVREHTVPHHPDPC
jgi:hypothetical protein